MRCGSRALLGVLAEEERLDQRGSPALTQPSQRPIPTSFPLATGQPPLLLSRIPQKGSPEAPEKGFGSQELLPSHHPLRVAAASPAQVKLVCRAQQLLLLQVSAAQHRKLGFGTKMQLGEQTFLVILVIHPSFYFSSPCNFGILKKTEFCPFCRSLKSRTS